GLSGFAELTQARDRVRSFRGYNSVRVAVPPKFVFYRNWEKAFPRVPQVIGCSLDRFGGIHFSRRANPRVPIMRPHARWARHWCSPIRDMAPTAACARPDLFGILMDQSKRVLLAIKVRQPA